MKSLSIKKFGSHLWTDAKYFLYNTAFYLSTFLFWSFLVAVAVVPTYLGWRWVLPLQGILSVLGLVALLPLTLVVVIWVNALLDAMPKFFSDPNQAR